jgi:hypothetical protein
MPSIFNNVRNIFCKKRPIDWQACNYDCAEENASCSAERQRCRNEGLRDTRSFDTLTPTEQQALQNLCRGVDVSTYEGRQVSQILAECFTTIESAQRRLVEPDPEPEPDPAPLRRAFESVSSNSRRGEQDDNIDHDVGLSIFRTT